MGSQELPIGRNGRIVRERECQITEELVGDSFVGDFQDLAHGPLALVEPPQADGLVVAGRDDSFPVRAKGGAADGSEVAAAGE